MEPGEKASDGAATGLRLSLDGIQDEMAEVAFPYFGNIEHETLHLDEPCLRACIAACR